MVWGKIWIWFPISYKVCSNDTSPVIYTKLVLIISINMIWYCLLSRAWINFRPNVWIVLKLVKPLRMNLYTFCKWYDMDVNCFCKVYISNFRFTYLKASANCTAGWILLTILFNIFFFIHILKCWSGWWM